MRFVLASASPRRRQILDSVGFQFTSTSADLDEEALLLGIRGAKQTDISIILPASCSAEEAALLLARTKAEAALKPLPGDLQILAADTIVVLDQELFGKPATAPIASAMLQRLSGRTHAVITAHIMIRRQGNAEQVFAKGVRTEVRFRDLSPGEIDRYVQTGEPLDKAGAYAIQGMGATLISSIQGDYLNVIGLSLDAVLPWIRPSDDLSDGARRLNGTVEQTDQTLYGAHYEIG